jgi:hypothetical protein
VAACTALGGLFYPDTTCPHINIYTCEGGLSMPGPSLMRRRSTSPQSVNIFQWLRNGVDFLGQGQYQWRVPPYLPGDTYECVMQCTDFGRTSNVLTFLEGGMATFVISSGDMLKCKFYVRTAEQVAIMTHFYKYLQNTGGTNSSSVADALKAHYVAFWRALKGAQVFIDGVTVQRVLPTPLTAIDFSTGGPLAGTYTSNTVWPKQVQGLVRWFASSGTGRHGWGHSFMPFYPIDAISSGGLMAGGYVTSTDAWASSTVGTISVPYPAGIIGNLQLHIHDRGAGLYRVVDGWAVSQKLATQKRRGSFGKSETSPF